jgi:hypothetical protein
VDRITVVLTPATAVHAVLLLSAAIAGAALATTSEASGLSRHQVFLARVNRFYDQHWACFDPLIVAKTKVSRQDYGRGCRVHA